MKKLIVVGIFFMSLNSIMSFYAFASTAEIIKLDDNFSLLKRQKTDAAFIAAEKENFKKAQQVYIDACNLKHKELWEEAFKKMKKAANLGIAEAKYDLYVDYIIGRGCKKKPNKAVEWCKSAAEQGYPPALNVMGAMHEDGNEYIEKDFDKALDYYGKAIENGDPTAIENVNRIFREMGLKEEDII